MSRQDQIIHHIYISPGHNYRGHHGREPDAFPLTELETAHCVAGKGIEGDRYFGYKENFKGQITFFDWDVFCDLCQALNIHDKPPAVLRRNVVVQGLDLNALVGKRFDIQGVIFEGTEECKPCYWMNRAFGPGAEDAMQGRGGLRARIITSGSIQRQPDKQCSVNA
ncbi:MAG: molybdenum cofactor biosysynthesis protein [Candidatus Hydrogenedentes bacterium]|nr:molybdenum cofactor biosysynthesis protein [Candidatus Hydrogenedentota bacterium]